MAVRRPALIHWSATAIRTATELRPGVRPQPAGAALCCLVGDGHPDGYRIAVRRAPDSRGGSRYMWSLKPGARIEIYSPTSLLEIDWSRRSYCLVAGGIGITPIIGIAAALVRRNAEVALHYAVKSRSDAAFLNELSALLGDRLIIHASDEAERIDLDRTFGGLPPDALTILCRPMRALAAARGRL